VEFGVNTDCFERQKKVYGPHSDYH